MADLSDCIYTLIKLDNGTTICPGPYNPPSTVANFKLILPCFVFGILCFFTIVLCFKDRQEKLAIIKSGVYKKVKNDQAPNLRVPQLQGREYNGVTMMLSVSNNLKKKLQVEETDVETAAAVEI